MNESSPRGIHSHQLKNPFVIKKNDGFLDISPMDRRDGCESQVELRAGSEAPLPSE
jgi:hypothetical protein